MTYDKAAEAAEFIRAKIDMEVHTAVVLGSGLGSFADGLESPVNVDFDSIPHFARSTVEGHAGKLVGGYSGNVPVLVQQGRFHYYEGYDMDEVTLPMRAFGLLGIRNVVLTNAAGSTSTEMTPGSLMLITDHLNLMGVNPLRGPNDIRFGPRFPDMTCVYDREMQEAIAAEGHSIAAERFADGRDGVLRNFVHRGVYCALSGPTYETPAEIRLYRLLGADAVGMSTVPEAIVARHQGIRVAGISCITNFAAGMTDGLIDHGEVIETGQRISELFGELIKRVIARLSD